MNAILTACGKQVKRVGGSIILRASLLVASLATEGLRLQHLNTRPYDIWCSCHKTSSRSNLNPDVQNTHACCKDISQNLYIILISCGPNVVLLPLICKTHSLLVACIPLTIIKFSGKSQINKMYVKCYSNKKDSAKARLLELNVNASANWEDGMRDIIKNKGR